MTTKALLTSVVCSLLFIPFLSAQIYVKHDAAGANDGSSWADAYTDLQTAFNSAAEGSQLWIAAGTYKPMVTGDTIDAYFRFLNDLEVYGGFNGTETDLSQRDWKANQTILSGDHLNDDADGNFDLFRSDNSRHVMWFTDTLSQATILDGLTVTHGHSEGSSASGNDRRGGGILTYSPITIRNCVFSQNHGYFGGGLYPRGLNPNAVRITNCEFNNNFSSNDGAGIYVNCPLAEITDCVFQSNRSADDGTAIFNATANGSTISNCSFIQNSSDSRTAGIYNSASPSTIIDCTFDRNRATSSTGAAIHVTNSDDNGPVIITNIQNCTFERNESNWGGAVSVYNLQAHAIFTGCTFEANSALALGGASSNGFGASTTFNNCTFTKNKANNSGGAVYNQNDSSTINIIECVFSENEAVERGGAINVSRDSEPSGQVLPQINIVRSTFLGNTALEQGGALNISNVNLDIDNSLFALNFVINTDGVGGAISLNTSDTTQTQFSILNTTFALNTGDIGAGIANWMGDEENSSTLLTVQNCIFSNDGDNYTIEDGMPVIVSAGGNLSSDNSLSSIFTHMDDLNNTGAGFVDLYSGDFTLLDGSPCVNTGVDAGASPTDIEGNPRLGRVDKGAFENQNVVGVHNTLNQSFGALEVFPTPAREQISFTLENNWKGAVNAKIFDTKGSLVLVRAYDKVSTELQQEIDINDLQPGVYFLNVSNGLNTSIRHIVKQ